MMIRERAAVLAAVGSFVFLGCGMPDNGDPDVTTTQEKKSELVDLSGNHHAFTLATVMSEDDRIIETRVRIADQDEDVLVRVDGTRRRAHLQGAGITLDIDVDDHQHQGGLHAVWSSASEHGDHTFPANAKETSVEALRTAAARSSSAVTVRERVLLPAAFAAIDTWPASDARAILARHALATWATRLAVRFESASSSTISPKRLPAEGDCNTGCSTTLNGGSCSASCSGPGYFSSSCATCMHGNDGAVYCSCDSGPGTIWEASVQ